MDRLSAKFLFLFLLLGDVHAQSVHFAPLAPSDGLSSTNVRAIYQDRYGYVWFGTGRGLSRFDSDHITVFQHDLSDTTSLSFYTINAFAEDHTGALWIGTVRGLNRFDRATETFQRYYLNAEDPGNPKYDVWALLHDRDGILWVGTEGAGLYRYDPAVDRFVAFSGQELLQDLHVEHLYQDREGRLWAGTHQGGLTEILSETEAVRHYPVPGSQEATVQTDAIIQTPDGLLWIGTRHHGLQAFDPSTHTFVEDRRLTTAPATLSQAWIRALEVDKAGRLWVGTEKEGLYVYHPAQDRWDHYQHDEDNPTSLPGDMISALYQDQQNNLWVGTSRSGVGRTLYDNPNVAYVEAPNQRGAVNTLLYHPDSQLWLGTDGNGIQLQHPEHALLPDYLTREKGLSGNTIISLLHDTSGYVWIGTFLDGISRYDLETQQFTSFPYDTTRADNAWVLHQDRQGTVWVGTDHWFKRYDNTTHAFERVLPQATEDAQYGYSSSIRDIEEDSEGHFWVATLGGLYRFTPATRATTLYDHDQEDPQSLSNNWVFDLLSDDTGMLWLATAWGGVNRFDPDDQTFTTYRAADGLPSDHARCLVHDEQGQLWVSTEEGVAQFDAVAERFYAYPLGTRISHFNRKACKRLPDGRLVFGTQEGALFFHPDSLKADVYTPPVVFTDFRVFNESVPLDSALAQLQQLTLTHDQNIFSLHFSALDFSTPDLVHYAYQMEGLREQWVNLGNKREVTFTNLNPDTYTLRVQATYRNGGSQTASIAISVLPPFWRTWWFVTLVGTALLATLYSAHAYRTAYIRRHNRELEHHLQERKQAEATLRTREQLLSSINYNITEGISRQTASGDWIYVNDAFLKLFGYETLEEVCALEATALYANPERCIELDKKCQSDGKIYLEEALFKRKDGTTFWGLTSRVAVYGPQGTIAFFDGAVLDITDRKIYEHELVAAKEHAEEMNRLKTSFLANMSHEVRTPLTSILGFSQLLESTADEKQRAFVEPLVASSKRLSDTFTSIFELAKIESGTFTIRPTPFDFSSLILAVVHQFSGEADRKGLSLTIPSPSPTQVVLDKQAVYRIASNIISNAIKFTHTGDVQVRVHDQLHHVELVVVDTGIGIDERFKPHLFTAFRQESQGLERTFEGSGLGLHITAALVQYMEGQIEVDSTQGQGTTVHVRFPKRITSDTDVRGNTTAS